MGTDRGKKPCKFPMKYKGKSIGNKCTKKGHHSLWCYTASSWGHCPDTPECTGATKKKSSKKEEKKKKKKSSKKEKKKNKMDCNKPSTFFKKTDYDGSDIVKGFKVESAK